MGGAWGSGSYLKSFLLYYQQGNCSCKAMFVVSKHYQGSPLLAGKYFLHCLQDADCFQGTPLKSGTAVRLQHVATRRWLHSHHFPSPLSQNLEVLIRLPYLSSTCAVYYLSLCSVPSSEPSMRAMSAHHGSNLFLIDSHCVSQHCQLCVLLSRESCAWMQVSAFGNDKESDHLDNWEVQFSGSQWSQDQKVVQISIL